METKEFLAPTNKESAWSDEKRKRLVELFGLQTMSEQEFMAEYGDTFQKIFGEEYRQLMAERKAAMSAPLDKKGEDRMMELQRNQSRGGEVGENGQRIEWNPEHAIELEELQKRHELAQPKKKESYSAWSRRF